MGRVLSTAGNGIANARAEVMQIASARTRFPGTGIFSLQPPVDPRGTLVGEVAAQEGVSVGVDPARAPG